jgi:hypothetical protein
MVVLGEEQAQVMVEEETLTLVTQDAQKAAETLLLQILEVEAAVLVVILLMDRAEKAVWEAAVV